MKSFYTHVYHTGTRQVRMTDLQSSGDIGIFFFHFFFHCGYLCTYKVPKMLFLVRIDKRKEFTHDPIKLIHDRKR